MKIKQITNENFKDKWNSFVIKNSSPTSFLQSWEWGDFKIKTQNSISKTKNNLFKFGIFDDTQIYIDDNTDKHRLIAVAQFIKHALPNNKYYLNCPKGPIIKTQNSISKTQKILKLISDEIKKISKQENIIFFRIAPPYNKNYKLQITNYKLPKILTHLKEPENTLILDLSKSEQELLKAMHQKTRYNLRLAERKGVKISNFQFPISKEKINIFYDLLNQTAKRDKINIFSKNYYQNLLQITSYKLQVTLFIAEHENQPLASIITIGYGDTATYFYGASSDEKRNLMPNYLIQWQAIKWAKKHDYKYYDFWGIKQPTINNQQVTKNWKGISRFKKGFVSEQTGQEINFIGTFDYVLDKKWYNIFKIGKFLKNIL